MKLLGDNFKRKKYLVNFKKVFLFIIIGLLIAFEYISCIYFIIFYLLRNNLFFLTIFLLFFIVTIICFYISYFKTVFWNPGYLIAENSDEMENEKVTNDTTEYNIKLKLLKSLISKKKKNLNINNLNEKYKIYFDKLKKLSKKKIIEEMDKVYFNFINKKIICHKCNLIKKLRAHHCKICNKCVERMDHHCPYIGNCVGKNNMKDFIRFVFFATLSLPIVFISVIVFYFLDLNYPKKTITEGIILDFSIWISIVLVFMFGPLCIVTIYNALKNITTIENKIKNFKSKNPFNKGKKENLVSIFRSKNLFYILNPLF